MVARADCLRSGAALVLPVQAVQGLPIPPLECATSV